MIYQCKPRLCGLALGAIFIGACGATIPIDPTEIAPIPTAIININTQESTQIPATVAPVIPTEVAQPKVDVNNIYIGKDEGRQLELLVYPLVDIVSLEQVEEFPGSYADIFLEGKSVTSNPILGGEEMLGQLILLLNAARENGFIGQTIYSSYRSFEDQVFLINRGEIDFLQDPNLSLAPAGRSEHQLGTAIDLGWGASLLDPIVIFNNETAGVYFEWLKANAHGFGFVISYPFKANEDRSKDNLFEAWITEYKAETWHIRYVGVSLATHIYEYQDEEGRNYLDTYSTIIPHQFYLP
jgi:hypothetical protein